MLEIRGLTKRYGAIQALAGIDLDVRPGQILGLLGPNGAGKTSLVSIVAGLRKADAGTVLVGGVDVGRRPEEARRALGIAPQDLGLYPTLTTRQNLDFFAELAGLRGRRRAARVEETAMLLGLGEKLDAKAGHLSGGQKRRLHTAMALLGEAGLLLLDEPTAGADISTRAQLLDVVRARAEAGAAVVYSTHYLPEIEHLGADVAIIDRGRILVSGSCAGLVAEHGASNVELTFESPPRLAPDAFPGSTARVEGNVVRLETSDPEKVAAGVVHELADQAGLLRSLTIVRPSLDAVYLAVVGRRYEANDGFDDDEGGADGAG